MSIALPCAAMRRVLRAALLAWLAAWLPPSAWAHAEPYGFVDVFLDDGGLEARVSVHVEDLAYEMGVADPDSLRDAAFVAQHLGRRASGARAAPAAGGRRRRRRLALRFAADMRRPQHVVLHGPLFAHDPAHETFLNVHVHGALRHQDLLDAGRVTAFTLGHSLTLALAALRLVTPPGRVVEPLIALRIVYVGAANLVVGAGSAAAVAAGSYGFVQRAFLG